MNEISKLSRLVNRTFEKGAWHGPTVRETLSDITEDLAQKRIPGTHSIIELVAHMAAWRRFVIRKMEGDSGYKVSEEQNFPVNFDWAAVREELDSSQKDLLESLQRFPVAKLEELVPHPDYKYTFYAMIHGIIHHDLYHTGQIMLIKKSSS